MISVNGAQLAGCAQCGFHSVTVLPSGRLPVRTTSIAPASARDGVASRLGSVSTVDSTASVPEVSHSVKNTTQPVTATPGQRMAWEAARRDATNLVVAMLNADVTVEGGVLPWAKNTAKNKRMDLLLGYVNEIATTFMEEANGKI